MKKPKNQPGSGMERENNLKLPETEGQLTIDVFESPTEIVIKSTIAGVNAENLDIDIKEDIVTIRGFRKKDEEIADESYLYQECYWGAFSRTVILPDTIDVQRSRATLKNGILTIRLPKLRQNTATRVAITEE